MAPWRVCDSADLWDMCRYYFKKESKGTPDDPHNLCAKTIPPNHIEQGIFTVETDSWMREGTDLAFCSASAGFKQCKIQPGSHAPHDCWAGEEASPREGASSYTKHCSSHSPCPSACIAFLLEQNGAAQ